MSATITIDIDLEGNAKVAVSGVKGKSCSDVTKAFEKALGTVSKDTKTPEFYQASQQQQGAGK